MFKITKNNNSGQHHFVLRGRRDELLLSSETYTQLAGARGGIRSVKKHGVNITNYEGRTSRDDRFYFVLKAKNHKIIGTSTMFDTMTERSSAIRASIMVLSEMNTSAADEDVEVQIEEVPGKPKNRLRTFILLLILILSLSYCFSLAAQNPSQYIDVNLDSPTTFIHEQEGTFIGGTLYLNGHRVIIESDAIVRFEKVVGPGKIYLYPGCILGIGSDIPSNVKVYIVDPEATERKKFPIPRNG